MTEYKPLDLRGKEDPGKVEKGYMGWEEEMKMERRERRQGNCGKGAHPLNFRTWDATMYRYSCRPRDDALITTDIAKLVYAISAMVTDDYKQEAANAPVACNL